MWEHEIPCVLEVNSNGEFQWPCGILLLKTLYLHYPKVYGHQNGQGCDFAWETSTDKATWLFDHMVSWDHVTNHKYISTTTMPMATWHGIVMTYFERLSPIKSHQALMTWFCEIMWQMKNTISPLLQCPWPPNVAGWLNAVRSFHPWHHIII